MRESELEILEQYPIEAEAPVKSGVRFLSTRKREQCC